MSRTLRFVITTTILFFGVLAFVSAYAQESEPVPPGLALKQDAVEYSKAYGVTLDEAIRRLELQGMIGVMNYLLTTNEQETFGGLWIEHIPEFRVIVKFTHNGQKIIEPYLNESIADVIELQAASVPLTELQSTHRRAMELVHPLDIPVDSALNIRKAQVELFVVKRSEFDTELLVRNIQLPNHTKVITVERLSELATNIYGGLMLTYAPNSQENYCTSGFVFDNLKSRRLREKRS